MKLEEVRAGQVFKYAGFEWVKLAAENGATLVILKDVLKELPFNEDKENNWSKATLRNYLNEDFYETLLENGAKEEDLIKFSRDLTSDDGMKDYGEVEDLISLITCDEYRKYRELIPNATDCWWALTPYSCLSSYSYYVRFVYTDGSLSWYDAYNGDSGVRPLCNLKSDISVSTDEEKENITDLIKQWAKDRELDKAEPKTQMVKLIEELGELAKGINKDKKEQIIDSIGDTYVVLTILSMQFNLNIEDCITEAYNEIKDRKGKMVNRIFVKESDL